MSLLDDKQIANRLKTKREALNLSKRKFAMQAGIDQSQYAKIENGELSLSQNILDKLVDTYSFVKEEILHGIGVNVPRETQVSERAAEYIARHPLKSGAGHVGPGDQPDWQKRYIEVQDKYDKLLEGELDLLKANLEEIKRGQAAIDAKVTTMINLQLRVQNPGKKFAEAVQQTNIEIAALYEKILRKDSPLLAGS